LEKNMSQTKLDVRVDPDIVQAMVTHLRNDTTNLADCDIHVPVAHFVNPERARAEIALMKTLPLAVAHCSELPEPGDFITRELLGIPLILSRQADGSVQSFLNMCSHRGGRVEIEAQGRRRVFSCRYHGWSFDAQGGGLRTVPFQSSFDPIDRDSHGLERFKTEQRHGLIFVDFSNNTARSLADYLGPEVDAQLEPWQLDQSVIVIDKTFTLDVNWKLVIDGATDIMHPQFLHPGGVGDLIESNLGVDRNYGRHQQHFGARRKLRTLVEQGAAPEAGTRYIASNLALFPNLLVITAPEHIECWTVYPHDDPGRSTVNIRFYVRRSILSPEIEARVHKSWEILSHAASKEDWPMEEWIQQNAKAQPRGTFRYARSDVTCQHLHRQLARELDGIEL
jgi:phenylpropionate dioxygenase-like ring-hydroxylating dioxygenase large terminal subunit